MPNRIPFFAANWKMNKSVSDAAPYLEELLQTVGVGVIGKTCDVLVAPPASHLSEFSVAKGEVLLGAQNCGPAKNGAYTGEIPPTALKELGVKWVILGHSERRHVFHETIELVATRTAAALDAGLSAMLCVGEKLDERKSGHTFEVVKRQLEGAKGAIAGRWNQVSVAYEPVWAIGTGENATPEQAQEVHAFIRGWLAEAAGPVSGSIRILYGGSAKPENAAALMSQPDIDGLLVGGASLEGKPFATLIKNGLTSAHFLGASQL